MKVKQLNQSPSKSGLERATIVYWLHRTSDLQFAFGRKQIHYIELWSSNSTYYQDAGEELEGSSVLLIYFYLERKPFESPWLAFLSVSHCAFPSVSECFYVNKLCSSLGDRSHSI